MGPANQRWGQFLFLILLISSFFFFILQAEVDEDFQVDLHDAKSYEDFDNSVLPKSANNQLQSMKKTNSSSIVHFNPQGSKVQSLGLVSIINLTFWPYSLAFNILFTR